MKSLYNYYWFLYCLALKCLAMIGNPEQIELRLVYHGLQKLASVVMNFRLLPYSKEKRACV